MSGGHTGGDARLMTDDLDKSLLLDQANRLLRQLRTMADRSTSPERRHVLRDAIISVADVIRDLEDGL